MCGAPVVSVVPHPHHSDLATIDHNSQAKRVASSVTRRTNWTENYSLHKHPGLFPPSEKRKRKRKEKKREIDWEKEKKRKEKRDRLRERKEKMSWQVYVDDHLMCDVDGQHLTSAAIIGHDGSLWAQSDGFPQVLLRFHPSFIQFFVSVRSVPHFVWISFLYLCCFLGLLDLVSSVSLLLLDLDPGLVVHTLLFQQNSDHCHCLFSVLTLI